MRRRGNERHPWPPQAWAVAANAKGSPDGRAAAPPGGRGRRAAAAKHAARPADAAATSPGYLITPAFFLARPSASFTKASNVHSQ
jgi:hypothetical protein